MKFSKSFFLVLIKFYSFSTMINLLRISLPRQRWQLDKS